MCTEQSKVNGEIILEVSWYCIVLHFMHHA